MPPTTSLEVRANLARALELDLVGPAPGHRLESETLAIAPSRFYLTGFLVPHEADPQLKLSENADDQEELDAEGNDGPGDDERASERASARRVFFPSSMGLSVCVGPATQAISVEVTWADYVPEDVPAKEGEDPQRRWRRVQRRANAQLPLDSKRTIEIEGSNGLRLRSLVRTLKLDDGLHADSGLEPGSRAVSVFLVNGRRPDDDKERDRFFAFQVELTLRCDNGFCGRPNLASLRAAEGDVDERIADLQYRDAFEYGVGHGVSCHAIVEDGHCRAVRSRWVASAEVEKVIATQTSGELDMKRLSEASSAAELRGLLEPLVNEYAAWISRQSEVPVDGRRADVLKVLLEDARIAKDRIAAGIALLEQPLVFKAFCLANRAMEMQARRRGLHKSPPDTAAPRWRPFQLAFLLMNLAGIANPAHSDRERVDLLFFPTGGGKTEAYLGLAAFTLILRRLTRTGPLSCGVTVLMRYTLRLLTLDQLHRASALVCALELLRRQAPETLGAWPFEIGLWVGRAATPNRIGRRGDGDENSARQRTLNFKRDSRRHPSPVPIEACPWCNERLGPDAFNLEPNDDAPDDLRICCFGRDCDFRGQRLPVLTVDEAIYRRLPGFLIATLDKFAGLPWEGRSGALFGKVQRHDASGFYGPCDPGGRALPGPLPPPELIIQDELHLISGPLGTIAGLYEAAIDRLASVDGPNGPQRPKIVASTATVRRAQAQICALFARSRVDIFPPPGPDRRDSFFARTVKPSDRPARLYLGVGAQGRSMKVVLLRTYVALLAAAQRAYDENGGAPRSPELRNSADPYMTLVGYFNSLRELGGSRRIIEDEVSSRLLRVATERLRVGEATGDFANRRLRYDVVELTSRESNSRIAGYKRALERPHHEEDHVDVAIATNMISVGLDIPRLGLMVVLGQPKSTAEYIQATSRVGRDEEKGPGLVIALLNPHRPRDRSHYERFELYHQTFYRSVEPTSVTPFARRAVDRALPAVVVGLARHGRSEFTPPKGAMAMGRRRADATFVSDALRTRAEQATGSRDVAARVNDRAKDLIDDWARIADEQQRANAGLQYQHEAGSEPPLLHTPLDPVLATVGALRARFKANRSLRDVEPNVNLFVRAPETGQALPPEED